MATQIDFSNEFWQQTLMELVEEVKLTMDYINRAAGGVLRLKMVLGLFENPYHDFDSRYFNQASRNKSGYR